MYEERGGLRLVMASSGANKWLLRFTLDGKRREMRLCRFPDVGITEAHQRVTERRRQVKAGFDTIAAWRSRQGRTSISTNCATCYIRAHRCGWRNTRHPRHRAKTVKTYARPEIGSMRVDAITTEDILRVLAPIRITKTETAKQVQGRLETILDNAVACHDASWRSMRACCRMREFYQRTSVNRFFEVPHSRLSFVCRSSRATSARGLRCFHNDIATQSYNDSDQSTSHLR